MNDLEKQKSETCKTNPMSKAFNNIFSTEILRSKVIEDPGMISHPRLSI